MERKVTHSGGKPHENIGDRGQRYEVSVFDEIKNKRIVIGWTASAVAARIMSEASMSRPSWKFAKFVRRLGTLSDK